MIVVKIGGSLYDLPDLGPRLRAWLAEQTGDVVLVPGGGPMVDALRQLDAVHHLGEEACHWLALRILTVNAHFVAELLPGAVVSGHPARRPTAELSVIDVFAFARADEANPERLPHSWEVTSDSLALRVAVVTRAPRLVLLKSVGTSGRFDPHQDHVVDRHFHELLRRVPGVQVDVVNFRAR